jgi:hypothetical protein
MVRVVSSVWGSEAATVVIPDGLSTNFGHGHKLTETFGAAPLQPQVKSRWPSSLKPLSGWQGAVFFSWGLGGCRPMSYWKGPCLGHGETDSHEIVLAVFRRRLPTCHSWFFIL